MQSSLLRVLFARQDPDPNSGTDELVDLLSKGFEGEVSYGCQVNTTTIRLTMVTAL
jgi:hypothetical protein